jgi:hypothetical protein
MKETTLIEMKNKVDALTRVMQQVIYDVNEAVEKLKEEYEKVSKIANEAKKDKKLELDVE